MATQVIRKGQTAKLIVDTNSFKTSDSPFFRFVFSHDTQKINQEITLENLSTYPSKYGYFTFDEGTDLDLKFAGDGKYIVYDANDVQVDIGKIVVLKADQVVEFSYPNKNVNNFIYS